MKIKMLLICLFFSLVIGSTPSFAVTPFGLGYKCSGKTIKKGSATVSAASAKAAFSAKLKPAKAKLNKLKKNNASEDELRDQMEVVEGLEQSILYVGLCTKGKLDGVLDTYWKTIGGFFEGTYTIEPFGYEGSASFGFSVYGKKFTGSLNIGGLNLSPLQFRGAGGIKLDPVGSTFPAKFTDKGTNYGDMSFVINKDGPFTVDITNVPSNVQGITHVVVNGNRVGDTMTFTAELRGANDAAIGTMQFNLQREP